MADLALITDHTAQALALLIDQYRDLPRLAGLVGSYTNRLQEFESTTWDVINKRLLDNATSAQLDTLGRVVGQRRGGQSDAVYLIYIRARIFLNKSRARRGDLAALLKLIEPAVFLYTEYYPATVVIEYTTQPATSPAVLADLEGHAVTGGVRLELIAQAQTDGFLLCGDTPIVDSAHGVAPDDSSTGGYLAGVW